MKRIITLCALAALLALGFAPANAAQETQQVRGTLWPGESYTFEGVTVTWNVSKATLAHPTPEHTLSFVGPTAKLEGIPVGFSGSRINRAYIDGVYFGFQTQLDSSGRAARLDFTMAKEPAVRRFHGGRSDRTSVFVSSVCPIHLDDWTFTVSRDDKPLPDGSLHPELTGRNERTGEVHTTPLAKATRRGFGRFTLTVEDWDKASRTAGIRLAVAEDSGIRGRLAYVGNFQVYDGDPLETILSKLAQHGGFEVEWAAHPGHPESVEFIKRLYTVARAPTPFGGSCEEILDSVLKWEPRFARAKLEWIDDTHLRVSPRDYEQVIAQMDEEKKNQARSEEVEASFTSDYQLETRVYPLQKFTPITAKALLEPELSTFYLVAGSPYRIEIETATRAASLSDSERKSLIVEKTEESIIADDKANALVVRATPATHARIAAALADMENMLKGETSAVEIKRYRLELVLLEGVPEGGPARAAMSPSMMAARSVSYEPRMVGVPDTEGQIIAATPATTTARPAGRGLETRLESFVAERENIEVVIPRLARESGVSLALSPRVAGRINVNLRNASVRQILEVILPSLNATYRETGGIVQILANEELLLHSAAPGAEDSAALMKRYGLSKEELSTFGITAVRELGRGVVALAGEPGRAGRARVALTEHYLAELEFLDLREPYLIVKGSLSEAAGGKTLLENTLYLRPGESHRLGLTNLRQALILVVRLQGEM